MNTKHTPGPWHVCTNKAGYPYQIRASFADEDKPGGLVDITRWASLSMPSSAEGQANARLIAAAPDMLAALKQIAGALDDWASIPPPRDNTGEERALVVAAALARAVIKATGA